MNDRFAARDAAVARIQRKMRGKVADRAGMEHEQATCLRLIGLGFVQVERVATPTAFNRRLKIMIRTKKVSGDIKATDPRTGRAVHCECKRYPEGLEWGRLKPHQRANLDQAVANRAIAILSWGSPEPVLLDWQLLRAAGFGPRTSLTPAMVAAATYRYH